MARSILTVPVILVAGFLAAGREPTQPPAIAPLPRLVPIDDLVRQLGSEDFAEREAATRRLSALALDPPPALLAAANSDDPEVRDRARKVAAAMRLNAVVARLPRGERFAERGEVDLFVAATAGWELKPDDPRLWEPALDLGRALIGKTDMKGDRKPEECPATFRDFAAYRAFCKPRLTRVNEVYRRQDNPTKGQPQGYHPEAIQAQGVREPWGLAYNVVISRGDVEVKTAVQRSLVFANGDVKTGSQISNSVIICDGDVETPTRILNSLIIARGSIKVGQLAAGSVLFAGGRITVADQGPPTPGRENSITDKAPKPLGVTFFELAQVGLDVLVFEGRAVQVSKVAPGLACEKAGVKAGDVILTVNDRNPFDTESLRRLLRDALAVGDAVVKVRRGDQMLMLKVALPD